MPCAQTTRLPEEFARGNLKESFVDEERRDAPPAVPASNRAKRGLGASAVGIGLLVAKFKTLWLFLLSLKWILIGGKLFVGFGLIFASIWLYAQLYTWKFAIAFVLLIIVHELGHWYAARSVGIAASLPILIPGLGAVTMFREPIRNGAHNALIAIAGPLAGAAASGICYLYGAVTQNNFWYAAAHIGFLINAFNLLPVLPFDGGRIAGSISTRIWLIGVVALLAVLLLSRTFTSFSSIVIVILVVASIPRAIAAWRKSTPPLYGELTPQVRLIVAAGYFALFGLLGVATYATQAPT